MPTYLMNIRGLPEQGVGGGGGGVPGSRCRCSGHLKRDCHSEFANQALGFPSHFE